jgi:hypothetical protein
VENLIRDGGRLGEDHDSAGQKDQPEAVGAGPNDASFHGRAHFERLRGPDGDWPAGSAVSSSGRFAMLAAIRRASSRVSTTPATCVR